VACGSSLEGGDTCTEVCSPGCRIQRSCIRRLMVGAAACSAAAAHQAGLDRECLHFDAARVAAPQLLDPDATT